MSLAAVLIPSCRWLFSHLTQNSPGDSALAELQGAIAKSYSSEGQDLVETQLAGSGAGA
ncbi:hypothetical protein ACVXG8_09460 [Escherichia coli]